MQPTSSECSFWPESFDWCLCRHDEDGRFTPYLRLGQFQAGLGFVVFAEVRAATHLTVSVNPCRRSWRSSKPLKSVKLLQIDFDYISIMI